MTDALCLSLVVVSGAAIGAVIRAYIVIRDLESLLKRETASTIHHHQKIKELKKELLDAQRYVSIWRKRYYEIGMGDG